MRIKQILLSLFGITLSAVISADELHMKNGSKLVGTLVSSDNTSVTFDTPFAGRIEVKLTNVERFVTVEPVVIMLEDGAIYRDRRVDATDEHLIATAADKEPVDFAASDVKLINPEPWKIGEGYGWTGNFTALLEAERGNSDTDEWDVLGRTTWQSLRDRYQLDGELERDEAFGEKTKDKWKTRFKYDRFFKGNPNNYWGGKLRFEYDRFLDLDLRTIVGPHVGRQFFDSRLLSLHGELGPVWVDERYDAGEDNDYPGALWEFEVESDIIGFGTTVYVIHDGILNFDETDELVLNTRVGIKMPLIYGFETGFEAKYEYDGGVEDDIDDLDETYNFNIGYTW